MQDRTMKGSTKLKWL